MTIKVKMLPHPSQFDKHESGIKQVVLNYSRYFPRYGVELVEPTDENYDLKVVHAGMTGADCDIAHLHGMYWTSDYNADSWEYGANANIVHAVRHAKQITVPSDWVAETLRRDMRINPHVIGHGIDVDLWTPKKHEGYVLWNKNRNKDVCDPTPMALLAQSRKHVNFMTTFMPYGWKDPLPNVSGVGGIMPHDVMKNIIERSMVYLSTTKETFGIGILEAMAAGVPVLGFDWGGNRELIQHGQNGYLVPPNDIDALAEGLDYCIKYRDVLGANGREMARQWTWDSAVEKIAGVYRLALESHPYEGKVSVIIPVYNYAEKLSRAVESALEQTYEAFEVIIIDDGSTDATQTVGEALANKYDRVIYRRFENSGVAYARNRGIKLARGEFISCLDADDLIRPQFLEACVTALKKDRSLGIAYTGLYAIRPDGTEGLSPWPTDPDYDKHLTVRSEDNARGLNQVPTCCVFRREAWERTGGYKQRYAPLGAGAEDAEFWARIFSIGYRAQKVTSAGLFVYSDQSGRVSAAFRDKIDINLIEPFWLSMHPWAKDRQHPFASPATPVNGLPSHPVRQYDEPMVSVIIPVGPGHEENVLDALDSLEAQTYRQWEAIVVWDNGISPDNAPSEVQELYRFNKDGSLVGAGAYPYTRNLYTGSQKGAGYARNRGAEIARAPFLVFLDADDTLDPTFIEKTLVAWQDNETIIYTDYYNSIITTQEDLHNNWEPEEIVQWVDKTGKAVIKGRSVDYDCERAQQQQLSNTDMFHWALVTCLVPKLWHDKIGGFDEVMESFEDVLYHWKMARFGYCYTRIEEPLVYYRLYTGTRRERASLYTEEGRIVAKDMLQYAKKELEKYEMANCSKCPGGAKNSKPVNVMQEFANMNNQQQQLNRLQDEDFVEVDYIHPNKGNHHVRGAITKIHYGYKGGGAVLIVHKSDIEAQPQFFREKILQAIIPVVNSGKLSAPQPITNVPSTLIAEPVPSEPSTDIPDYIAPQVEELPIEATGVHPFPPGASATGPHSASPRPTTDRIDIQLDGSGTISETSDEIAPPVIIGMDAEDVDFQAIPGITAAIAQELHTRGYNTKQKVLDLGRDGLMEIRGIGELRADSIIEILSLDQKKYLESQAQIQRAHEALEAPIGESEIITILDESEKDLES